MSVDKISSSANLNVSACPICVSSVYEYRTVQWTVSTDNWPVLGLLNYSHDNINIIFDGYFDGGWKSSDPGSSYAIAKTADKLIFRYDVAAAGAAVTWNIGMSMNTAGLIEIDGKIQADGELEMNGTVDNNTGDNEYYWTTIQPVAANAFLGVNAGDGEIGSDTSLDFAETFPSNLNSGIEAADVVVIAEGTANAYMTATTVTGKELTKDNIPKQEMFHVEKATKAKDSLVIGVVSTAGISIGPRGPQYLPIGVAGRVPVKVVGPLKFGDHLTSSNVPGHAMVARGKNVPIIGMALESFDGDGTGKIQMLIKNGFYTTGE